MKFTKTPHENTSPPHNCGLPWTQPKLRGLGDPPCPACDAAESTAPKRAEPGNEHAKRLRSLPCNSHWEVKALEAAAAEIERLELVVERLWARRGRDWLPIESAPRDGTRVELWGLGHRGWKAFYAWHNGHKWLDDHDEPVMGMRLTHWRREPAGPSASPPLPSG